MKKYRKKSIGARIREAREKRFRGSVNMREMAKLMNKPYRTIQNWEGGVCVPKQDDMIKLANMLKVDPGWLRFGPKSDFRNRVKEIIKTHYPARNE